MRSFSLLHVSSTINRSQIKGNNSAYLVGNLKILEAYVKYLINTLITASKSVNLVSNVEFADAFPYLAFQCVEL